MRLKKGLITFLVTTVAMFGMVALAGGQGLDLMDYLARYLAGETVARVDAVDDTDAAIVIKFVGSNTFAKVAIEADGNLTFTQDNVNGTTASTELECPVSAPLGGVIDVSDAACDTFGEVVDIINASTSWRAVLIGALRSDSSNDTLNADAADQEVQTNVGDIGYFDTNVAFKIAWVVSEKQDARNYIGGGGNLLQNPWNGTRAQLKYLAATSTYASGTSTFKVYSVKPNNQAGTETVTELYSVAGGATTVEGNPITLAMFGGILGKKDEKLVVRLENSAAMATTSFKAYGSEFDSR